MRKDFQEIQRDSLIDEIVNLVEYAEGDIRMDEDEYDRACTDIEVNWADENTIRVLLSTMLSRHDVHFKCEPNVISRAGKIREFIRGEDLKYFLSFVFGLMSRRMMRSDVYSMLAYAKEVRNRQREIEAEEKVASVSDVMFETVKKGKSTFGKLASSLETVTKKNEEEK